MKYYQFLITGDNHIYDVPRINITTKVRLISLTLKFMAVFKKVGGNECLKILEKVKPIINYNFSDKTEKYLFARKVNSFVQIWINVKHKQALCLERATVICAALRFVGLPAQVVIGRRRTMMSVLEYEFHAWVELEGVPVNDKIAYKQLCMETHRVPQEVG
ncbi:lasso peptide biosynthesis B2 protein [Priestia endophytica]|uniref:Transglutaminase-like superfamily protein n=1 Tax=Priestia endophytica DSM 13796 TaxID=1121089 RepID=A0A1I6BV31_9BACI|nr:lasso peptide biosynthesis B2 protein [Priestia endophytica]KYG30805.1 hypothetical protein AZF06_23755 [Priestia endophytica]MBG9811103.1 hypothetical protein [Priestia endophytica]SFQ84786.1 Transglutaminase-like superfamily protein [Priestia endophytica DSM 13796]